MDRRWEPNPGAALVRRLGRPPVELGASDGRDDCPDIWELSNGDIAVVGRDLTANYATHLPHDLVLGPDERLVVIPRTTLRSALEGLTDA
ncbi:hypothetical protein [Kitasatospora sp. LaBMicrA B282]|uniref:hypothetical protein n=1 Tax=Kitasatospora sp. LaBMicrA B282 TaxID=3420949 RepID=UPI003D102DE1